MSDHKRKQSTGNERKSQSKRQRTKRYNCAKERYYSSSNPFTVEPGISGIIVTCNRSKEKKCEREMYSLFNEYANQLYQPELEPNDIVLNNNEDEIEVSIEKEIESIKTPSRERRFESLSTGIDCVVFIRTRPPVDPVELVQVILKDLSSKRINKTRFSHRIVPVTITCLANMTDIEVCAAEVLKPWFHTEVMNENGVLAISPKSFAIVSKIRNSNKVTRDELINKLAGIVGPLHKVNLEAPELCIIVEVFKSICAISVVENYYELKKFNVQQVTEDNSQKEAASQQSKGELVIKEGEKNNEDDEEDEDKEDGQQDS